MLSRRCLRLLATRRVLQHRHLTVASTPDASTPVQKEEDVDVRNEPFSFIDFRKNRSDLMRNTVWVGWFRANKAPVNITQVLSVVRYMEKRCGAIRDFLVIRARLILIQHGLRLLMSSTGYRNPHQIYQLDLHHIYLARLCFAEL
jgi:hypothetical protein